MKRVLLHFLEVANSKLSGLVLTALLTTTVMISVGSIVRVTGHGLGCPDWPLCYGQAIPPLGDISAWIEFSHRLIGLIVALQFALILLVVWRYHRNIKFIFWPSLLANMFLVFQILLGGIHVVLEIPPATGWIHTGNAMMLIGLVAIVFISVTFAMDWHPTGINMFGNKALLSWVTIIALVFVIVHISLYRLYGDYQGIACPVEPYCKGIIDVTRYMTVASLSGLLVITLLYFVRAVTLISNNTAMIPTGRIFYRVVTFTLVALYLLLLSGSYVTRSGASLACLGFPLCGSVSDSIKYLVNIHLMHRYSAYVVAAILLSIAYVLANVYVNSEIRYFGHTIFVLVIMQIVLGGANILLRIPMWSRVLHLTIGALLWVCVAMLWMMLTIEKRSTKRLIPG